VVEVIDRRQLKRTGVGSAYNRPDQFVLVDQP
jgi:hypothetical protein